jgi:hypothetical protein
MRSTCSAGTVAIKTPAAGCTAPQVSAARLIGAPTTGVDARESIAAPSASSKRTPRKASALTGRKGPHELGDGSTFANCTEGDEKDSEHDTNKLESDIYNMIFLIMIILFLFL